LEYIILEQLIPRKHRWKSKKVKQPIDHKVKAKAAIAAVAARRCLLSAEQACATTSAKHPVKEAGCVQRRSGGCYAECRRVAAWDLRGLHFASMYRY